MNPDNLFQLELLPNEIVIEIFNNLSVPELENILNINNSLKDRFLAKYEPKIIRYHNYLNNVRTRFGNKINIKNVINLVIDLFKFNNRPIDVKGAAEIIHDALTQYHLTSELTRLPKIFSGGVEEMSVLESIINQYKLDVPEHLIINEYPLITKPKPGIFARATFL